MSDLVTVLQTQPLFQSLEQEVLRPLLQPHRHCTYAIGQSVVMQHDWGEGYYLILDGLAKVSVFSAAGDEVVLGVLGRGEVFGELRALGFETRSADVTALRPLEVVHLQSSRLAQALEQQGALALAMARLQSSRLLETNRRMMFRAEPAGSRLLEALYCLGCKAGPRTQDQQWLLVPPVSVGLLGSLAGLARETASRELTRLEKKQSLNRAQEPWRVSLQALERVNLSVEG